MSLFAEVSHSVCWQNWTNIYVKPTRLSSNYFVFVLSGHRVLGIGAIITIPVVIILVYVSWWPLSMNWLSWSTCWSKEDYFILPSLIWSRRRQLLFDITSRARFLSVRRSVTYILDVIDVNSSFTLLDVFRIKFLMPTLPAHSSQKCATYSTTAHLILPAGGCQAFYHQRSWFPLFAVSLLQCYQSGNDRDLRHAKSWLN